MPHSPLPWFRDRQSGMNCDVRSTSGHKVSLCYGLSTTKAAMRGDAEYRARCDANAAFIVQACNSHNDLLEALRAVARVIENTYGHDEETGERIDLPGDYSAADIVEQLCGIELLVSDAIAKATECES